MVFACELASAHTYVVGEIDGRRRNRPAQDYMKTTAQQKAKNSVSGKVHIYMISYRAQDDSLQPRRQREAHIPYRRYVDVRMSRRLHT